MSDDFMGLSGLVEGTATAFANTWKTSASCADIMLTFGHPCSLSFNKGTASLSSHDLYMSTHLYCNESLDDNRAHCFITIPFFVFHQRNMPCSGAPN